MKRKQEAAQTRLRLRASVLKGFDFYTGWHNGAVVRIVASPQEVCGFDSETGHSVWSSHVLSQYSIFLLQSKDVHFRLIGISGLSVGVSVVGLFMLALLKLSTCPGCTLTSSLDSWHRLQHPRKPECRISGNRGWDGGMNLILQHYHPFFILTEERGS